MTRPSMWRPRHTNFEKRDESDTQRFFDSYWLSKRESTRGRVAPLARALFVWLGVDPRVPLSRQRKNREFLMEGDRYAWSVWTQVVQLSEEGVEEAKLQEALNALQPKVEVFRLAMSEDEFRRIIQSCIDAGASRIDLKESERTRDGEIGLIYVSEVSRQ